MLPCLFEKINQKVMQANSALKGEPHQHSRKPGLRTRGEGGGRGKGRRGGKEGGGGGSSVRRSTPKSRKLGLRARGEGGGRVGGEAGRGGGSSVIHAFSTDFN